ERRRRRQHGRRGRRNGPHGREPDPLPVRSRDAQPEDRRTPVCDQRRQIIGTKGDTMSFFKAMDISSSGLAAQRLRMNVLSANLANAQSTRGEDGVGPYKRRDVVFSAVPAGNSFEDVLGETNG